MLEANLRKGEIIDTRPDIMILERDAPVNLTELYDFIAEKKEKRQLNVPLKAFFGDISLLNNGKKEPEIVIYDEKANIDQIRAIYNAMKNPVTYVHGPPGTGKTQTIFNVVLSCFFSDQTVLVCSMNNKPVDALASKMLFSHKGTVIPIPYLRLGNSEEVSRATLTIREVFRQKIPEPPSQTQVEELKKRESDKNAGLIQALRQYEARKSLEDNLACAEKVLSLCGRSRALEREIENLRYRLAALKEVTNEEAHSLVSVASQSEDCLAYLYFSSLRHLAKLAMPRYDELRNIVAIEVKEERVRQFNGWTRKDDNMKLLTDAFPLIFSTNISSLKLGSGSFMFDHVIMDEAGQCDVAKALIPIARGNSLLLVGDVDQLEPVIVLDPAVNERLKTKYGVSADYDYMNNSILSAMQKADNISKRIMLTYHYRSGKKIIAFSNQYFYGRSLKLTEAKGEGEIELRNVRNERGGTRNECFQEALAVADYVERNHLRDTVIITPFVKQAYLINDLLAEKGIIEVKASTIHSMQGAEASSVILSMAISNYTSEKTFGWLKRQENIVNVAASRSRDKFVIFADKDAIAKLSETGDNAWNELVKYANSNGNCQIVPRRYALPYIGKSNGSAAEDEFFKTMAQFCSVHRNLKVIRNVPLRNVCPEETSSD
jgi:superfamily I DNA and/or RNA helicase